MLYQVAPNGLSLEAAFPVTPSLTFDTLTFERGTISVELQAPAADGRDLAMIGPEGGAVSASTGERLEIPAGAAAEGITAHVERLSAADLGITVPAGLELLGAVSVNLSGAALGAPAALSIARPLHIADSTGLLLARLQLVAGVSRFVLVSVARVAGERVVSDAVLPGLATPFESVRQGGRYLFLRATTPVGLRGGDRARSDRASHSRVRWFRATRWRWSRSRIRRRLHRGSRSRRGHTHRDRRRPQRPRLELREHSALTRHRGDRASPRHRTASPAVDFSADGAQNVTVSGPIVARFSEPIDPASVTGANAGNVKVTLEGGADAAGTVTLSVNNTSLTFRPSTPLLPNASYIVTLAQAIADAAGNGLEAPIVTRFSSLDTNAPPPPAAGSLSASIPGADGTTTIEATQGTAGAHDTVSVLNVTRGTPRRRSSLRTAGSARWCRPRPATR